MSTVNVLVTVNVIQAIQSKSLQGAICLIDTNGYLGSFNEATPELTTVCNNADTIVWSVVPLDPNEKVSIVGFTGAAVPSMIKPVQTGQFGGTVWSGRVEMAGNNVQYTMTLLLENGTQLSWDPFITATQVTATAKK